MSEISNNERIGRVATALTLGAGAIMGTAACNSTVQTNERTPITNPVPQGYTPEETIISDSGAQYGLEKKLEKLTPKGLVINLGEFGTFQTLYNYDTDMYHLGISEDYQTERGTKTLEDLKRDGGFVELTLPFDSIVNVSGGDEGKFYVNDQEWNLGNPAENEEGEFVIEAGQTFRGEWEAGNDSAGLEIMMSPTGSFDDFEYSETVRPTYQTEEEQKEFTPLDLETNLQALGTYKWVYDSIQEKYILQIAEKHQVALGEKDLEDVKEEGGRFFMSFPWETRVNSIVGVVKIDGDQVLNGNPVYNDEGNIINKEYMIPANTLIEITYQAGNASNGFQVEIDWPLE